MSGESDHVDASSEFGHRAHVTLVFSDLCDYTALSEASDPEDIDALRDQLDELVHLIVRKHSGHVSQVYGDGRLCVFGFPTPSEHDVRRAIDSALELHAAVRSAPWPAVPASFEPRLHTAVHSGLVFVRKGTELHGRYKLSGDAVNTTARLCAIAQRDEVIVSEATMNGSEQFYEVAPIPPVWLRGKSAPQSAFRVTGRTPVRTRFEARSRRGLTKFVNRRHELATLLAGVRMSRGDRGRLILVRGPAGIGKTRLLEEFRTRAQNTGVRVLHGTCENYGELVPLEPFSHIARQVFGDASQLAEAAASDWIEQQCERLGPSVMPHRSTFSTLLALQPLRSGELANEKVVLALTSLFEALAMEKPLTLILDDWHWADGASQSVLGQLLDVALLRGVCVVIGTRASELIDLTLQPDDLVPVTPLSESDCTTFIDELQPDSLSLDLSELVLQRAGGNPLFLEELCRALPHMSSAERMQFERLDVPATVQSVIQTRVAGLPHADRQLLRLAAVIGIEFSCTMLAELCETSPADMDIRLLALVAEDLIYSSDSTAAYHFKHGLMREVVYESVLIAERKQLHGRVAALIERTAAPADDNMHTAEALAYNFRGSGDLARAAHFAELAGDHAMKVSALDRACHHYVAAMKALDALPVSREQRRKWLAICAKWGLPFVFSPVHAQTQLELLHTAIDYASELDDRESKAMSCHWLGWARYCLGDYAESIRQYTISFELARELGNERLAAQAQAGLGQSQAATADYEAGLENIARAVANKRIQARSRPAQSARVAQGYAYALGCMGLTHADRGDFSRADQAFQEALAAAGTTKHAIEGSVLALRCIALLWRGHWREALETAQRAQQNAQRVNSAFNFVTCSCYGAYAAWESTRKIEHMQRLRVTTAWIQAQHLELYASADYGWLAHALQCHSDDVQARAYVERALRRAAHGDPMGEAMAYRVLARLGPEHGPDDSHVEECLKRATRAGEARGSLHEAAKTQLLRAELSFERGDPDAAHRWAEASSTTSRALGMSWHLECAEQLLASLRQTYS